MDKQFKARWIAALRSGKYKQGRGQLRREGLGPLDPQAYCCLGVACVLTGAKPLRWSDAYPSVEITEGIGLTRAQMNKLASMNDVRRFSFRSIANWIEKNL